MYTSSSNNGQLDPGESLSQIINHDSLPFQREKSKTRFNDRHPRLGDSSTEPNRNRHLFLLIRIYGFADNSSLSTDV
jgi:hypothetical protein